MMYACGIYKYISKSVGRNLLWYITICSLCLNSYPGKKVALSVNSIGGNISFKTAVLNVQASACMREMKTEKESLLIQIMNPLSRGL